VNCARFMHGTSDAADVTMLTRWEYKNLHIEGTVLPDAERMLNALGAEGWELCGIVQRERHGYSKDVLFVLKRPVAAAA
jgi:hypothetical protein